MKKNIRFKNHYSLVRTPWQMRAKRAADIALALSMLVCAAPAMFVIAVFIKLDSKGPIFYRQLRIGINRRKSRRNFDPSVLDQAYFESNHNKRRIAYFGQPFQILKFRSMRLDAEAKGHQWCKEQDPRITRFGALLRKTHLDELPQIFNILKGDMSLVGPRPERPEFMKELLYTIPDYEKRLLVKPGLTGLAQVLHRSDLTIQDVKKKVKYDLLYLKRGSVLSDIRIMFATAPLMFGAESRHVKKINRTLRNNIRPITKFVNTGAQFVSSFAPSSERFPD